MHSETTFKLRPALKWAVWKFWILGPWLLAVAAGLSLATAERQWPAFPAFDSNLEFGPFGAGGSLTQTLQAPSTPLSAVALYVVGQPPNDVALRVFDGMHADEDSVIAEARGVEDPTGRLRFDIPPPVDTSGRRLLLQIVNPVGSGASLTLQANFADPYTDGLASAHGDPGDGRVDIRLDAWRRMTPVDVAREVAQRTPLGAVFAAVTVMVVASILRRSLPSWSLVAAIVLVALRLGFEVMAPWMG